LERPSRLSRLNGGDSQVYSQFQISKATDALVPFLKLYVVITKIVIIIHNTLIMHKRPKN